MELLDTSVVITMLRDDQRLREHLLAYRPKQLAISAVTRMELEVGLLLGEHKAQNRRRLDFVLANLKTVPFDDAAAQSAAKLLAAHEVRHERAPVFDAMIAAHANALGVPVAYCDGDFDRLAVRKLAWLVR